MAYLGSVKFCWCPDLVKEMNEESMHESIFSMTLTSEILTKTATISLFFFLIILYNSFVLSIAAELFLIETYEARMREIIHIVMLCQHDEARALFLIRLLLFYRIYCLTS